SPAARFNQYTRQSSHPNTVEARSSSLSSAAELKDFIALVLVHGSTCASPGITTALSNSPGNVGITVRLPRTGCMTSAPWLLQMAPYGNRMKERSTTSRHLIDRSHIR